jgi:hypothetical protein
VEHWIERKERGGVFSGFTLGLLRLQEWYHQITFDDLQKFVEHNLKSWRKSLTCSKKALDDFWTAMNDMVFAVVVFS